MIEKCDMENVKHWTEAKGPVSNRKGQEGVRNKEAAEG